MKHIDFDIVIGGCGASGLLLVHQMNNHPFFHAKKILLIDKVEKIKNDRTWCYWEEGKGRWDYLLSKEWSHVSLLDDTSSVLEPIAPYTYKMLRSKPFYKSIFEKIKDADNIKVLNDLLISYEEHDTHVDVICENHKFKTKLYFDSISSYHEHTYSNYPLLLQSFVGLFIKVDAHNFSLNTVTLMDFTVAQDDTSFIYILPLDKHSVMLEYTSFGKKKIEEVSSLQKIAVFLEKNGISEYKIFDKEKGTIPMTVYPFWKKNTDRVVRIGSAGGWTKASTGYTFKNSELYIDQIIQKMLMREPLGRLKVTHKRFRFYDMLFIDVLHRYNHLGRTIFMNLFKKNKSKLVLKFLEEKTNLIEEFRIFWTLPKSVFFRAMVKRIRCLF